MRDEIFDLIEKLADYCYHLDCPECPLYSWGGKCCGLKIVPPEDMLNPHILRDRVNLQQLFNDALREQGKEV